MIDTAEGAHDEVSNMLQRMRELAVQSGNDSNSDSESENENKYTEYTDDYLLVANSKDRNYKNGEKTFSYNILFGTNFNQNSVDNGNNNAFFTRNYETRFLVKAFTVFGTPKLSP